jgi:hypothetical protein
MDYLTSFLPSWSNLSDTMSKKLLQFILKQTLGKYLDLPTGANHMTLALTEGCIELYQVSMNINVIL